MNDLEKLLEYCKELKNEYDNPMTYVYDATYYTDCFAKSLVLDEVIDKIKLLMTDKS
jgi:hypothetical protein